MEGSSVIFIRPETSKACQLQLHKFISEMSLHTDYYRLNGLDTPICTTSPE